MSVKQSEHQTRWGPELSPQQFVRLGGATGRDELFRADALVAEFAFSEAVTSVFPDMIGRSVPGYWENVDWLGVLVQPLLSTGDTVYDLGCSLGAVGWSIDRHLTHSIRLIAVDSASAMIRRLRANLAQVRTKASWHLVKSDVLDLQFESARVMTMHYCLQFIPPSKRQSLIESIYDSLSEGGALFLSEKIRGHTPLEDRWLRTQHHDFKYRMGYTRDEIVGKAESIATMMPVETIETHESRLLEAGFRSVHRWRQSLNFVSWIAIK